MVVEFVNFHATFRWFLLTVCRPGASILLQVLGIVFSTMARSFILTSIVYLGTAAAKSTGPSYLDCAGSVPGGEDWPRAWLSNIPPFQPGLYDSTQDLCDRESRVSPNGHCYCNGVTIECATSVVQRFCHSHCRCTRANEPFSDPSSTVRIYAMVSSTVRPSIPSQYADFSRSENQVTSAIGRVRVSSPPGQTVQQTCGGSCTKLHGCSSTCVCIATPKPARPMEYLSNCLQQIKDMSMGINPKMGRDSSTQSNGAGSNSTLGSDTLSNNTVSDGDDAAVLPFVIATSASNGASSVFEDAKGAPLACPCNSSYVSYACCNSTDGIVFEPASSKLGTLDLTARD